LAELMSLDNVLVSTFVVFGSLFDPMWNY